MERQSVSLPIALITAQNFLSQGKKEVCYVRECNGVFAKYFAPGIDAADTDVLFCVFAADGVPLTITTTRDLAIGVARTRGLSLKSTH
jgi:hypothetical protein